MLAANDNISFNNLAKNKGLRTLYKQLARNIPTSISGIVSMIEKYFTHINSLIKNKIQDKLKFPQKIHLLLKNGVQLQIKIYEYNSFSQMESFLILV